MKTHYINHHPQWVFLHCIKQVAELLEIQRSSAAACCDLNTKLWNCSLFFKRHSEQMKWNCWFIKRLFRSKAYCLLFLTCRLDVVWNPTLFVWRIATLGYVSLLISVLHTHKHTLPLWYSELVSVGSHHALLSLATMAAKTHTVDLELEVYHSASFLQSFANEMYFVTATHSLTNNTSCVFACVNSTVCAERLSLWLTLRSLEINTLQDAAWSVCVAPVCLNWRKSAQQLSHSKLKIRNYFIFCIIL